MYLDELETAEMEVGPVDRMLVDSRRSILRSDDEEYESDECEDFAS